MDDKVRRRMNIMFLLARENPEYNRMFREMAEVERRYDRVLGTLPGEKQDMICDFVSLCEEMSLKVLEIACTVMEFPE